MDKHKHLQSYDSRQNIIWIDLNPLEIPWGITLVHSVTDGTINKMYASEGRLSLCIFKRPPYIYLILGVWVSGACWNIPFMTGQFITFCTFHNIWHAFSSKKLLLLIQCRFKTSLVQHRTERALCWGNMWSKTFLGIRNASGENWGDGLLGKSAFVHLKDLFSDPSYPH